MIRTIRIWIASAFDWADSRILKHRYPPICSWIYDLYPQDYENPPGTEVEVSLFCPPTKEDHNEYRTKTARNQIPELGRTTRNRISEKSL